MGLGLGDAGIEVERLEKSVWEGWAGDWSEGSEGSRYQIGGRQWRRRVLAILSSRNGDFLAFLSRTFLLLLFSWKFSATRPRSILFLLNKQKL